MKYTTQQLKRSLTKNNIEALDSFKINNYDREYQFWKKNSLGIELFLPEVFEQKFDYIHYNTVKAGLCINPEDYYYSSAGFYYDGIDNFGMFTHYSGN